MHSKRGTDALLFLYFRPAVSAGQLFYYPHIKTPINTVESILFSVWDLADSRQRAHARHLSELGAHADTQTPRESGHWFQPVSIQKSASAGLTLQRLGSVLPQNNFPVSSSLR